MALAPGTHLGPYEIVSVLGAGGMGEVYRAHDPRLSRSVAVKVLPESVATDPDRVARFAREAQVLAALNHPNIAHIYGLEKTGPSTSLGAGGEHAAKSAAALVMELVEGPTLAERIAQGPVPVGDALPIARQIADALEYAHEHGIVHRDLKPANIKLRVDGTVKVLDFGLAKAFESPAGAGSADVMNSPTLTAHATRAGVILGTAAYMAPEQARGGVVDRRADIWAFGAVLFEMLTGRPVFDAGSTSEIIAAVMRDEPQWDALPASTPPHVMTLLRRCLERDPRQRLRDIGEARVLLERPASSTPPVTAAPSQGSRRARRLWPALAAVGVSAAIAAVAMLLLQPNAAESPPALPLQFTIPPPPTAAALNHQSLTLVLAVARDGQHIATVVPDGIWLWSAASGSARLLDDTAGAAAPFFSPDGNHIAFFARGELRRVPVAGGPASLITRASAGDAGTWGKNESILYTNWIGPQAGLWQVSARGGESRLVEPAPDFVSLRAFPSFLPDGEHYLFLEGGRAGVVGQRQICIGSLLAKSEPECIAQGDSNAVYAASGHVVFVRAGTLVALPIDIARRQPSGEATTLVRGMRWFGPVGVAMFALSADGHTLVHVSSAKPRVLTWFDRSGRRESQLGAPAMYNQVRLSPDGRRVAVDIWNAANGGRDLWTIDRTSGVSTRLTFEPIDSYLGAWAPHGRTLVYARPDQGPPDLFELALDGGTAPPRLLLKAPGVQLAQDWSSDGGTIAYLEVRPDQSDHRDVSLLSMDGKTRRLRETPGNTLDPRFSPDSRLLAYVSDESGQPEVYVAPVGGTGQTRRLSRSGGFLPRWRGDGRELFFLQPDGMLVAVDPAADSPPQPLFRIEGVSAADFYSPPRERSAVYDVTSDGKRFLVRLGAPGDRADDLRVWKNWAPSTR